MAIPKIIHQTWKNESIPQEMTTFQQTWKEHHSSWEYRLWTDRDNREFIENYYSWFLPVYDAYRENICRVDAVRYFIMYHYGGLYVDLDFECLRPVDQLLEKHRLIFGLEPSAHVDLPQVKFRNLKQIVCPSFIASEPAHPFWSYFFQHLVQSHYLRNPVDATGPFILTHAYNEYSAPSEIKLLPAKLLYPATKFDCWEGRINDQKFRQTLEQEAFAIHHWHGTWFKDKTAARAAQVVKKLPLSLMKKGRVVLHSSFQYNLYQSLSGAEIELPLISCLMVTKNRVEQAKCAIQCFLNQTYAHRELVIIDDGEDEGLAECTQQLQDSRIKYLHLPSENKTLGELRNLAVKAAGGTYICQWDDYDLSDPLRLEVQMAALLALAAEACFLQRWMLWWPSNQRLAISRIRIWEGSILCLKSRVLAYPEQWQGEDTLVAGQIVQHCRVALLDCPQLYAYVIHNRNTFDAEHFEEHWQLASERFEGRNYDHIVNQLCDRLPIEYYPQVNFISQPTLLPVAEASAAPNKPISGRNNFYDEFHLGLIDYYQFPDLKQSWGKPFNGQIFRQKMFLELLEITDFTAIVETGTYRGTTTDFLYQASKLPVYTVESHPRYYAYSKMRFFQNPNIKTYYNDSRAFLRQLSNYLSKKNIFFYLDAHWNDDLPLRKEIQIIFSKWYNSLVLIDDFQVPDDKGYLYDDYGEGKALTLEYLNSLEQLKLAKFFPAKNSEFETGAKRGCIVLAKDPDIIEKLKRVTSLRSYSNPK